jgi:hypothetical protein
VYDSIPWEAQPCKAATEVAAILANNNLLFMVFYG